MISWKVSVDEIHKNDKYIKTVESYVRPAMDYLCERLNENDLTNFESTEDLFKKIFDELPIMNFKKEVIITNTMKDRISSFNIINIQRFTSKIVHLVLEEI